jgi:hypothetical protein
MKIKPEEMRTFRDSLEFERNVGIVSLKMSRKDVRRRAEWLLSFSVFEEHPCSKTVETCSGTVETRSGTTAPAAAATTTVG